ncbi:aminoglycoside phosphotransferase family protein [Virgibacillus kekensis]|uniref:Aminoglycoside phosphotransferase family protein n=1 Tax=Virgibacillus kekensis TaxID=202261 RepID=A0ABV9DMZ5_9BACI
MTTEIFFASNKIEVNDKQIQLMLNRFSLGKLLSLEGPTRGVMGQTIFVSTTNGDFVLKGNPIYDGQFLEEKFFVENINKRTNIPVPLPYRVDMSEDIFGWSYSVMPRFTGVHINNPYIQVNLTQKEKIDIAKLLGKTMAKLHSWRTLHYGEYEPINQTVRSFEGSYQKWLYKRIRYWLEDAKKYSLINFEDVKWVEWILDSSQKAFARKSLASFVMGDFKPDNFLLEKGVKGWSFKALFDFTTAYFGDPIADLPRMVLWYLSLEEKLLAKNFIFSYLECSNDQESFTERLKVHLLQQLVLDWGCAWATDNVTWNKKLSFSNWAKGYTDYIENLKVN